MSDYIRFIINDEKNITLDAIEAGIKSIDPKFKLAAWDRECECAELLHGNDLYGEIELCHLDQDEVDEEIEELIEDAEDAIEGDKDRVIDFLKNAKVMFVIHVLWQGLDVEATIDIIAPLCGWLLDNYNGLLQADGEGYYDLENQILQTR